MASRIGWVPKPRGFFLFCALSACDPTIIIGAVDADATFERPDGRDNLDGSGSFDDHVDPDGRIDPDGRPAPDGKVDPDARSDGTGSPILWSADHESGNLSAWHLGGDTQGGEYAFDSTTEVSRDRAHGGSFSVKLAIDTSDGADHLTRLYRRIVSGGAFYSAWFYWTQANTPTAWWSIMLFRAQTDPADPETYVNLWDIEVARQSDGQMTLRMLDHLTNRVTYPSSPKPLPVGQWVQIEAFFQYAPPGGTTLTVWQDGDPLLDMKGLGQSPSNYLFWAIGNGSNGLTPPVSTIYVDDAAIATTRLGIADR